MATWDDVRRIALALPETEEHGESGAVKWTVANRGLFVWERPLRKSDLDALGDDAPDGDILGARVPDEGAKFALIAEEPGVYFTTPHFTGYPAILVRLAKIDEVELNELITEAWLIKAPKRLVKQFLAEP